MAAVFTVVAGCGDDSGGGATSDGAAGGDGGTGGAGLGGGAQGGEGGTAEMPVTVTIQNQGTAQMEGHTPRGFQGMGTGLFAGDNLNPGFPEGDGVQMFLSFDLSTVPAGTVQSAVLRSSHGSSTGSPFVDLGALNAEEIRYESFSSALWNQEPVSGGASCVLGTAARGPFECDLAGAVQSSLDDVYGFAQFRVRFDTAGDGDGMQDLAMFFISDSNTNEPGIFELEVAVVPAGQ